MTDQQTFAPARPLSPSDARTWAVLTHVSALIGVVVGAGFVGWLGPLIIFLVLKDRSPFVAQHAKATLNFQITMVIASAIAAFAWIVLVGFLLTGAIYVVVIVFSIVAAVAASRGQRYEYPLTIRFIR